MPRSNSRRSSRRCCSAPGLRRVSRAAEDDARRCCSTRWRSSLDSRKHRSCSGPCSTRPAISTAQSTPMSVRWPTRPAIRGWSSNSRPGAKRRTCTAASIAGWPTTSRSCSKARPKPTLADRAVAILEGAYLRIGTALFTYPAEVITVVLYTREQFHDITQSPDWAGGAYDGRIRVPVQGALANPAEFERVLTHEFTHALVHSIAAARRAVLARRGPCGPLRRQRSRGQADARAQPRPALLPLPRLEISFATLSAEDATLAYAQSAVAVHAMFDQAGGAGDCQPARGCRQRRAVCPRRSSARCSSPTPSSRSDSAPESRTHRPFCASS